MRIKPLLQKILQEILYTESESKKIKQERSCSTKPQEKKRQESRQ
jgi:hypothetical protein